MYTKTLTGLTAGQVAELVEQFGEDCREWDKAAGTARIDFATEEESAEFEMNYQFSEDWTDAARAAAQYEESSDAEWLGTYWSEMLTEDERKVFSDFSCFAAAVRQARLGA